MRTLFLLWCVSVAWAIRVPRHSQDRPHLPFVPVHVPVALLDANAVDDSSPGEHTASTASTGTPAFAEVGSPSVSLADFQHTGVLAGQDPLAQVRGLLQQFNLTLAQPPLAMAPSDTGSLSPSFLELSTRVRASASALAQAQTMTMAGAAAEAGAEAGAAAGAGVAKVHAFCEICILVMQMKERGQPHLCYGLNANYYITVCSSPFCLLLVAPCVCTCVCMCVCLSLMLSSLFVFRACSVWRCSRACCAPTAV